MAETVNVFPDAVLAGGWELVQPLPVNGATYIEPKIVAVATAGYFAGDGNAPGSVQDKLILPPAGSNSSQVEIVGTSSLAYTGSTATSWAVPIPTVAGGIKAGDLIVIDGASQELTDLGPPSTPGGWTTRGSWWGGAAWLPRITRFFKLAAGGETGTVTVTGPGVRMHWVGRVVRGVDITAYFDALAATASHGQGSPNPAAITTASSGALVEVLLAANVFPAGADGFTSDRVPAGYSQAFSNIGDERGWVIATKRRTSAGSEDPAPFAWSFDNYGAVTDVYKPATNAGLTLLIFALVSDPTATGIPTPAPFTGQSEVQQITSSLTSGTFTLTYAGQTTGAIAWNASGGTVQAALEALSNIGTGDVLAFGGPLGTNPVTVVFQGALANQNVPTMTGSSGSVVVEEREPGHPVYVGTWEGSVNCPRWADGPAWTAGSAPQINIWSLTPPNYIAGTEIDVQVSDHGANNTYGLILLVIRDADPSNPISDVFGSAWGKLGTSVAEFGSITPVVPGSKVIAVLGQSTGALYPNPAAPALPTAPGRYTLASQAWSDRSIMSTFTSAPVPAVPEDPSSVAWNGSQDAVTGLLAIQPRGTAGTLSIPEVLSTESEGRWLEVASAAGSMYEIVEFDLGGLPPDAFLISARVDFAHSSNVRSPLRMVLVGIEADGTIVPAVESVPGGYTAEPAGQTKVVNGSYVTALGDGSELWEYPRLGAALISTERNPALTSHRVFWVRATITYEEGRPTITGLSGPAAPGDPISWTFGSSSGLPQSFYELRVIAGAGQDPETATEASTGLQAATGELIYSSGLVAGSTVRSVVLDEVPLGRGPCTVAVKAWSQIPNGPLIPSVWATADFDISGVPPVLPPQASNWTVVDHQTFDTNGDRVATIGFNGPAPIYLPDGHTGKFGGTGAKVTAWAYEGYGGPPDYHISPDIWPGLPNLHSGNTIMAGSNFDAYTGWSQQSLGWVDVPDRAAPYFGYLSPAAASLGMTLPSGRTWMARGVRINAHKVSGPYTWIQGTDPNAVTDPAPMTAQYVTEVGRLAALGFSPVCIEDHDMTGTDPVLPPALVADPMLPAASIPAGPIRNMVLFYDALAAAYQGGLHNVWIGLPNEAYAGAYSTAYEDFIVTLIRRLRGKGFGGIITWPLPQFAGNLALLASGGMDALMVRLIAHGVAGNQRPEWHFYGTDYASGGTGAGIDATYAAIKSYLEKCIAGAGGSGSTAYKWAVFLGEFGRPTPDGSWDPGQGPAMNAILNARTIVGVDIIAGTVYGTPLGQLFPDICPFWWSTADNTWRRNFSVTWGSVNKGSQTGPDPHVSNVGHPTGTFPPHDIPYLADPNEWLTVGGQRLWALGPLVAAATGTLPAADRVSFNAARGTVDVQIVTPAGVSRAWLLRSEDSGATWQLVDGAPFTVSGSTTVTIRDAWAPMMADLEYLVSLDAGPMTETSIPVLVGSVSTAVESWYLIAPDDPDSSTRIDVADYTVEERISSVRASQAGGSVVARSLPLGTEWSLQIRTLDAAERARVETVLRSGKTLRLVNILGQSWPVVVVERIAPKLYRAAPLASETTKLRDAHIIATDLVEVVVQR